MVMNLNLKEIDVSVILTLFNSRKFFYNAFDSLSKQTFSNFELIIVDDGSTDNIEDEIFPILMQNDNYKYIRHSNRKHPLSLNTGIAVSSGRYITFLDSDDEYAPEHLELRVKLFYANPEIDLINSPALLVGEEKDFFVPDANEQDKLIHLNDCIIGGTLFGKKEVFTDLGGFRNLYSHDSEFYQRAKEKYDVRFFDSRTYIYHRDNPESVINILKRKVNGH